MNWIDEGFLISKNRYSENSLIAEIFTKDRGKISGIIFGGTSKKIKNYLIEIGGEVRVKGTKPEGKIWTVQLENPNTDGTRSAYTYLQLTNSSMASSGNYRKFRMAPTGEKYVHTINPKTGFALESNLLAATVIAELDCADVDAYATAFMAMGLEKTVKFLEAKPHLKVVLIYVNEAGDLAEFRN